MLENGQILQFRRALIRGKPRPRRKRLFILQIFNNLTFIGSGTLNKIVITLPVGPCYCPDSEVIYVCERETGERVCELRIPLSICRRFIENLFCFIRVCNPEPLLIP